MADPNTEKLVELLFQILMGQELRFSMFELPGIFAAFKTVDRRQVIALALGRWISSDPTAANVLRRILDQAGR